MFPPLYPVNHYFTSGSIIPVFVWCADLWLPTGWHSINELPWHIMAPRTGLEPVTHGLEGRCSVQLSYRGILCSIQFSTNFTFDDTLMVLPEAYLYTFGASGGTRTLNPTWATDFKSVAYTNSATEAYRSLHVIIPHYGIFYTLGTQIC